MPRPSDNDELMAMRHDHWGPVRRHLAAVGAVLIGSCAAIANAAGTVLAQAPADNVVVTQGKSFVLEGIITGGMFALALVAVCFASRRV